MKTAKKQEHSLESGSPGAPTRNGTKRLIVLAVILFWLTGTFQNYVGISSIITLFDEPLNATNGSQIMAPRKTFQADPFFKEIYEEIDDRAQDKERCEKYGFTLERTQDQPRRRVFLASLIASESKQLFQIHAGENYNLYHSVSFVESNTTFIGTPRTIEMTRGDEKYDMVMSGLFGNETIVDINYWNVEDPKLKFMEREYVQRGSLTESWERLGMQPDDIGIISDIDEVFSRDFLRALQVCNVPEFNPSNDSDVLYSCQKPKIFPSTAVYEGFPDCRRKEGWYHPDLMIGHCIQGIGDPTDRVAPVRTYKRLEGRRRRGFGRMGPKDFNYDMTRYPLWGAQDFRDTVGSRKQYQFSKDKKNRPTDPTMGPLGIAYHFHNWFDGSLKTTLRQKYVSYGHANKRFGTVPLSNISKATDLTVRCVKNISVADAKVDQTVMQVALKFDEIGNEFNPIFFRNATYREERRKEVARMIAEDEAIYGSLY
eukprot:CAMPEP_0194055236 /NCGR_PEP_ID=MMETSP0009_2-20130614/56044_1 /TAXON_ID=210454 /ORGANISM="Grammatophora oceanica, Strain CCMP 410" /LENGTH=483 /DNA_ID=CAMNT_0038704069 /DNA_START=131 /DNA_END=1582 /DNA_ORIENTATION=-